MEDMKEPRGVSTLLPTANSNIPKSNKEKESIIKKAAKAYEKYLDALQIDWKNDPNSANTPLRVAKAFVNDIGKGCYDLPPVITAFPADGYTGMVFEGCIPVKSLCSHHHAPFMGKAHVAYIPQDIDGTVVGLSKLNRIVEFYCRRPQIQEALTKQIHDAIAKVCINNRGVAVMIEAQHTCVCNRGIKHDGTSMKTSMLSGAFFDDPKTREEFYFFVNQK